MLSVAVAQRWNQIQLLAHAAGVVCLPTTSWPESHRCAVVEARVQSKQTGALGRHWRVGLVRGVFFVSAKLRIPAASVVHLSSVSYGYGVTNMICTTSPPCESPSFPLVLDCNTLCALEHGNVSMGRCVCSTGYFGAQRALTAASAPLSAVFGTGVLAGLVAIVCTQAACLYSPCRVVCSCKAFGKEGYQALRLVCDAGCALSRVKAHARPLVHNAEDEWTTRVMVDDMDHNLHMNNRCVPCVAVCPRGAVLCHGL